MRWLLECSVPKCLEYPTLVLTRAATLKEYRTSGLNSALRYYLLQYAIRQKAVSILGGVLKGAPRVRLMEELGYEFHSVEEEYCNGINFLAPAYIATLREHKLETAISLLRQMQQTTLEEYPWRSDDSVNCLDSCLTFIPPERGRSDGL